MRAASLPGKIAWFTVAAALAVVAAGVDLDRAGRGNLAVARNVPRVFQADSLEVLARDAYGRGSSEQGLAYAQDLVRRRPVPAESLSLLANGLISQGDLEGGLSALLASAQRGWRDTYTQTMMTAIGVSSEDWRPAGQRLIALWRQGARGSELATLTERLLEQPGGVDAFSSLIVKETVWQNDFLVWAGDKVAPSVLAKLSADFVRSGSEMDCPRISAKATELGNRGQVQAAAALWTACASGGLVRPDDLSLRIPSGDLPGPFDWVLPEAAGLTSTLVAEGSRTVLKYSSSTAARKVLARRTVVLAPGRHVLKIDVSGSSEVGRRGLLLTISCRPSQGAASPSRFTMEAIDGANFEIPAQACDSQSFALLVGRGEGEVRALRIQ